MPKLAASPPDLKTQHGRLRWARENYTTPDGSKLSSPRKAADFFGWGRDTYKSHENGVRAKRGLHPDDAQKYARAYGVTLTWLMTGSGRVLRVKADDFDALAPEEKELALRLLKAAR